MFKKLTFWLIVAFIFRFALSFLTWHPDLNNHADWGTRFFQYGPAKFYSPDANVWSFTWPNQPPGTIYMFAGVRKTYEGAFGFLSYLHFKLHVFPGSTLLYLEQNLYPAMLKLPAELADLGLAYLIYRIVGELIKDNKKSKKWSLVAALVFLFNPVIWYNSAVWGQYDSVINLLALFAFYLLVRKKLSFALLAFAFSIYIKASLLIFAPAFLLIAVFQRYKLIQYFYSLLITYIVVGLVTLPFSRGEPLFWLYNLYRNKVFVYQLHSITANAFNFWGAVSGITVIPELFPETTPLLGLTYKYWSYILFGIFYIPSLLLIFKKQDLKAAVWSLAVVAFSSFMLLTNMHERYLYPLFPYFTIIIALVPELIFNYTGVSIINLLNLYNFWFVPAIPSLINFMLAKNNLFPRVLSGVNFALFIFFYLRFIRYNFFPNKKT